MDSADQGRNIQPRWGWDVGHDIIVEPRVGMSPTQISSERADASLKFARWPEKEWVLEVKRKDEEFAREAVSRYLARNDDNRNMVWTPSEAPDWILTLNGEELGVEVTWVSDFVELDRKRYPSRGVFATMGRWIDSLAADLEKSEDIDVDGLYIVSMRPFARLREESANQRALITEYIQETNSLPKAAGMQLLGGWWIRKWDRSCNLLSYSIRTGGGGWESEVRERLQLLVAAAIKRKERLVESMEHPLVLALVDDYHFADTEMWRHAVAFTECDAFSVVRVYDNFECDALRGAWTPLPQKPADQGDRAYA